MCIYVLHECYRVSLFAAKVKNASKSCSDLVDALGSFFYPMKNHHDMQQTRFVRNCDLLTAGSGYVATSGDNDM
jgi:hypothetical protein